MAGRRPASTYPASVSSGLSSTAAAATSAPAPAGSETGRPAKIGQPAVTREPEIDAARLRVAVLRLSRRLRKHDLAGLTPSQLSTLSSVGVAGPVRLGDLAAAERIAPSTLTRLVNVLEDRGYLLRTPAPDDARASLVTLTGEGEKVLARIREEATSLLADMVLSLPADQLAALEAALPVLEQLAGSG
jgi:DNA-binding MarR family transcriptional regulator